ncbi:ABC transporter ATP-binding protein [Thalassiella azotivora]
MNALHLHHLTVRHGGAVLVDVSGLDAEPGVPVTVVGESGSGKSLLAHAVMGTIADELDVAGAMTLGGARLDLADRSNRRRLWGRELAMLPQEPALALDPTMRVLGQVAEGVAGFPARRGAALQKATRALGRLGMAHTARSWPHTLSGGMAQRVAYAAATIGGARLLLVDEPTKGLDAASLDRLADLLHEHVDGGGLLVTITHDLGLARRLGGQVLVMREAEVVERGPADRVLTAPEHEWTRRLLAAEPARWRKAWQRPDPVGDHPLDGDPVVVADAVTAGYGGEPLFRDLSLQVRPGERWAVSGPSGVGKSTLGNVLVGLREPDTGSVRRHPGLDGGKVQKLYQDPALSFPPAVTLGTAVRDVVRRHTVPAGRLEGLMAEVGLPASLLARRPGQVSGGELQRLAIVRAMLLRPALVLADEATSRLDLLTQERTVDCLMVEVAETGCALVAITHDEDLARAVADRHLRLTARSTQVEATGAVLLTG